MMRFISYARFTLPIFLVGFILSAQAASWGDMWPSNAQETTVEELDDVMKPIKSDIKIKNLNKKQQQIFFDNKPKMLEKTKILNRVRNLKDKGIEKTKIIYRTRVIGLFNQKSDFNYFNLGDNIFDWPIDSEEDEDYSSMTNEKNSKNDVKINKKLELKDIDTLKKSQHNEMPKNRHSSKKELRNNFITVKSMEDINDGYLKGDNTQTDLNTIEVFDSNMKNPSNTFRKVHFVDSLELYKNEQLKKQQVINEIKNLNQTRPLLQRQFSFYRKINNNNEEKKFEHSTSKSLFDDPSNPIVLFPRNNVNNINAKEKYNQKSNFLTNDKATQMYTKPDLLGGILLKKVVEPQLAQINAGQSAIQPHNIGVKRLEIDSKQRPNPKPEPQAPHPFPQTIPFPDPLSPDFPTGPQPQPPPQQPQPYPQPQPKTRQEQLNLKRNQNIPIA